MLELKRQLTDELPDVMIFRVAVGDRLDDHVLLRVLPPDQGDVWRWMSYLEWLEMKKPQGHEGDGA